MTDSPHISRASKEVSSNGSSVTNRTIATEVPLSLSYNGVAHVVMMVTPTDLESFILGFSISEGIISNADDIEQLSFEKSDRGIIANIWIEKELHTKLLSRRRNLVGQSGCGLCGVEALEDALRSYEPVGEPPHFSFDQIKSSLCALEKLQPLHQKTGAVHGAAYLDSKATIIHVAEDVGRHNAFDKLIGNIYSSGSEIKNGAVILTSRCSFELAQKALAIKLPLLITISAPTDLAVQIAKDHNLSLITLARHDSIQIMNDPYSLFEIN